ncbi:Laminin subunit alpha-1 [Harpegnathos saltator]|uniref:Laminin subunit alpha-1 n=1 Tax=Harpegnathos saltator TaxID=610380 RepID=E2C7Q9_HARSA|nr:Laminin subunit alpha-1 [Harpegnathos saltator]
MRSQASGRYITTRHILLHRYLDLTQEPLLLSSPGSTLKNSSLFPSIFNVAAKAEIYVNATCGEEGPETFCKPSEPSRCSVCDSRSPDPGKRHHISNVLHLNSGRWWQSPSLARGHYEHVTILLDLNQVRK